MGSSDTNKPEPWGHAWGGRKSSSARALVAIAAAICAIVTVYAVLAFVSPPARPSGKARRALAEGTNGLEREVFEAVRFASEDCHCPSKALCERVTGRREWEVMGWSEGGKRWKDYDWSRVTRVSWNNDPALVCHAHAHGARVEYDGRRGFPAQSLHNVTARAEWIESVVTEVALQHLDAVNFDHEAPVRPQDRKTIDAYTALVAETRGALHARVPGAQVSIDMPWSPFDVDGRNWDWAAVAAEADVAVIMGYDLQSQIWGSCVASANAPLAQVRRGIQQYLGLGVPAHKLLLGMPWYGYQYKCIGEDGAGCGTTCRIDGREFMGAPCSDAVGAQKPYEEIFHDLLPRATKQGYDSVQEGHWFNMQDGDGDCYQVWYDSPASLKLRVDLAAGLGLGGVAVWNFDLLPYGDSDFESLVGDVWAAMTPDGVDRALIKYQTRTIGVESRP